MKWDYNRKAISNRFAKSALGALLALSSTGAVSAMASTTSSTVSFEAQYHSNLNTEAGLLAEAKAIPDSSPRAIAIQHDVTMVNNEISQLYYLYLVLTMRLKEPNGVFKPTNDLKSNIESSLHQIHSRWNANANQAYASLFTKALLSLHTDRSHWEDGQRDFLARLEATILALQGISITETKNWIAIEEQDADSTHRTLGVSVNSGNVNANGTLTYTIQLKNEFGNPVRVSGVKINVSLLPTHNDGNLQVGSVYTDSQGRASVTVTAGSVTGTLQLGAEIDGSPNSSSVSKLTQVIDPNTYVTHITLAGPSIPTTVYTGQSVGGSADSLLPQTSTNQLISTDTLTVSSSNINILMPNVPDTVGGNTVTLHPGSYAFPSFTAKASGYATITVRDVTQKSHPSITFKVKVNRSEPIALNAVNPVGTETSYDILTPGVVGPFTIAVCDALGDRVSTPHSIQLSAAEVNQLIGTGNGVRLSPSGPDVSNVVISPSQSSITVYADNASVGWTNPTRLTLNTLTPYITNIAVKNPSTIEVDYSQILNPNTLPKSSDFSVVFGWGSGMPRSVSVSGRALIIHMWGNAFVKHQAVSLTYNSSSDPYPLTTYWGAYVPNFANMSVSNTL